MSVVGLVGSPLPAPEGGSKLANALNIYNVYIVPTVLVVSTVLVRTATT